VKPTTSPQKRDREERVKLKRIAKRQARFERKQRERAVGRRT
jgi:hypothetical protein